MTLARPGRLGAGAAGLLLVVLLVALTAGWLQGGPTTAGDPQPTRALLPTAAASTHPASGLPYVDLADLPPEAAATVTLIDAGGPFPHDEDHETFGNYEGLLPEREHGFYREYTVETPGLDHRGARRVVAGADGTLYWTDDHYESFEVIRR